ncbi:uncharacterized protein [Mytilus edulis]|uniref:uncharacterized protein n=1 Tax=Mytilus edulis TaxID=6550 RepID=UPI0039F01C4E
MKQNLLDAEQRPLDSTILLQYQNFLLQELKQQSDTENKLEEIQQQISTNSSIVHSELAKIDDRITKMDNRKQNIIDQTKACIAQHEEDETYCPTLGVTTACEVMEKNNIVIIMSNQGGGKSKTSLQIATIYKERHFYQPMIFFSDDIVRYRDLLNFNEQSLFILEDLFGRTTLSFDEDTHRGIFDILYSCISQPSCKSKFIITMKGNQQTNRKILEKHKLFKKEVILELDLNPHEVNWYFKKAILLKHMSKHNIKSCGTFHERFTQCISEIVENIDTSLQICSASVEAIYTSRFKSETGFPLACHLFCSNKNFTRQGIRYFSRASQALVEEINQLRIKGFDNNLYMYKYSLLVYTALKDKLNVDNIDQQLLESILGHFEKQMHIKTVLIKEAFSHLKATYMIEQYSMLHLNWKRSKLSDTYMLQHSTVKEAILISYADFVGFSHCDAEFIYDYVRPKGFRDQKSEDMTFIFTDCKPLVKKLLSLASGNRACFSIGKYLKITGLKNRNDTMINHFFEEAKEKIRIKQYAFILDGLTDFGSENDFILFHPDISKRIVLYGSADVVCSFCKPMECPLSNDGFVQVKDRTLHTRLYYMLIGETFHEYETGSEREGLNYLKEDVEFNHCMELYSNKRNDFFYDVQKIGNFVYQLLFIDGGKKVSEMLLFDLVAKQCTIHPCIVKHFFDGLTDSGRRVDFVKFYQAFSKIMVFPFASIPVVLNLCRPCTHPEESNNFIKIDDILLASKLAAQFEPSDIYEYPELIIPGETFRNNGAYVIYLDKSYYKKEYIKDIAEYVFKYGVQTKNQSFLKTIFDRFVIYETRVINFNSPLEDNEEGDYVLDDDSDDDSDDDWERYIDVEEVSSDILGHVCTSMERNKSIDSSNTSISLDNMTTIERKFNLDEEDKLTKEEEHNTKERNHDTHSEISEVVKDITTEQGCSTWTTEYLSNHQIEERKNKDYGIFYKPSDVYAEFGFPKKYKRLYSFLKKLQILWTIEETRFRVHRFTYRDIMRGNFRRLQEMLFKSGYIVDGEEYHMTSSDSE